MPTNNINTAYNPLQEQLAWNNLAKLVFRVFFVYFIIQVVPLDWKFYRDLFSINWLHINFTDIFNIAHYAPHFYARQTYTDWAILGALAILAGTAWTLIEKNKTDNYNRLYYWLRVIVRYRLAIAVIAYGFIKFFPIQAPYPSLSNLNTGYGDFTRWKLFSLSLGIVPGYESFLGTVEIITGLLLLYRKTASIGAFIVIIFTGNVFMSNLAYGGGEQVYSLYLITLALFVLWLDIGRLANLLVFQRATRPGYLRPLFATEAQHTAKLIFKSVFILFFVVLYGYKTGSAFYKGPWRFPEDKGLAGATGIYDVSSFRINKDSLPYSVTDPLRWQDVVFEKWNTLSIRSNRAVIIDTNNIERISAGAVAKEYEIEGAAERHYYSYTTDTLNHTLVLRNKNKNYAGETLVLNYRQAGDSALLLSGINERKDSVFVVLNKIKKKYLLEEVAQRGRQQPIKL